MLCPNCRQVYLDDDGKCPKCGYRSSREDFTAEKKDWIVTSKPRDSEEPSY